MGDREHVVSVRLTAEESAYLDMLTTLHEVDRSSLIRGLLASAKKYTIRWTVPPTLEPARPECLCDLIDTSIAGGPPEYVRGRSNGCLRHLDEADAAARRKARD